MSRQRLGVGAELVPLVLILACLAGSLGLIIATYRQVNVARTTPLKPPVVVAEPAPLPPAQPAPVVESATKVVERPRPRPQTRPAPAPPPEDPTPKVLAELASAEAEQLLEASKANRKAQSLEEARQAAVMESERWRRRQSLIHSQLGTLETKVRKAETDLDAMAFERDALEKELDARKAAAARAKARPGQAILPHKGPNGTWRRPIVIECRNGAAVIQPQGLEFGLFDLESGFGASTNPFVRAVATEAIRVQRKATPDGAPVVPYIFFLVRPDGIRPYYEARGRLEPLGITFGYELADQNWEIELPNLDDTTTWDGSEPTRGANPTIAGASPAAIAEDTDLASWPSPRGIGSGQGGDSAGPFTFGGGGGGGGSTGPGGSGGGGGGGGGGAKFPWASPSGQPGRLGFGAGSAFGGLTGVPGGFGRGASGGGVGKEEAGQGGATHPTASLATEASGGASNPPPNMADAPPEGFPAEFLQGRPAGGDGSPPPGGDGPKLAAGGGDAPSGPMRSRVDASGRVGPVAPGLGSSPVDPKATRSAASGRSPTPRSDDPDQPGALGGSKPSKPGSSESPIELALEGPTADAVHGMPPIAEGSARPDEPDPASTFVWTGNRDQLGKQRSAGSPTDSNANSTLSLPSTDTDREAAALAGGTPTDDETAPPGAGVGASSRSSSPASGGGRQAAKRMLGQAAPGGQPPSGDPGSSPPPEAIGIGLNGPPMPSSLSSSPPPPSAAQPPPSVASIPPLPMNLPIPSRMPTPTEAGAAVRRQTSPAPLDWSPTGSIIDKTFEVVVVCGPQGVLVQPGNYRVTADALKDRDGLFKKQVVALVKNRRAADPKTQVEPRVRFLVQPQGFETYRTARSQFFVSGLNWPTTTQVADPDPLAISPGGVW